LPLAEAAMQPLSQEVQLYSVIARGPSMQSVVAVQPHIQLYTCIADQQGTLCGPSFAARACRHLCSTYC
jgi:hypothetical protein